MYLISDPHFDHKHILEYEDRPFKTLDEMKEGLIYNWNSTVAKKDEVWVLGDFCFGNKEMIKSITSRLNGRLYMIKGSHDGSHSYQWWKEAGFEFFSKYPVIIEGKYILSHEPQYLDLGRDFYNIHGHIHSKKHSFRGFFNVSVEAIGYKPIDFRIVKKRLEQGTESDYVLL